MKKVLLIVAFVLTLISFNHLDATNPPRARVAIVNLVDTTLTHVYGNRFYASSFKDQLFDYGNYTIDQLTGMLAATDIEVTQVTAPKYVNKKALLNFFGNPSVKLRMWMDSLKTKYNADFLVMIVKKFAPEHSIGYRFLQNKQYGVATYMNYPDALSFFSFVGYYIFSTHTMKQIKISPKYDQYVLMDLRLDDRMSYREMKHLPQKYLSLTYDKMKNIADLRNVEIKRRLLEYLNEH